MKRGMQFLGLLLTGVVAFVGWRLLPPQPGRPSSSAETQESSIAEGDGVLVSATPERVDRDNGTGTGRPVPVELTGRVFGYIYRNDGGPAAGAELTAFCTSRGAPPTGQPDSHHTESGIDGSFELLEIPLGPYSVGAVLGEMRGTATCVLTRDASDAEVVLVLATALPLGGSVVDRAGKAVRTGTLYPYLLDGKTVRRGTWLAQAVELDENGDFLFPNLEPGSWSIYVIAQGFPPALSTPLPAGLLDATIRLPPGVSVSGRAVADPPLAAAGGLAVLIADAKVDGPAMEVACDARGEFHFDAIAAGNYILRVRDTAEEYALAEDPYPLAVGAKKIDGIVLMLQRGGSIEGRIVDKASGAGVAGVEVAVRREGSGRSLHAATASTGSGDFRVAGLPAGEFSIRLKNLRGYAGSDPEFAVVGLRTGLRTSGVQFSLFRGATVRGRVLTAAGEPVAGARISCRGCSRYGPKFSDRAGNYTVADLLSGRSLTLTASTAAMESEPVGPFAVPESGAEGVDLVLTRDCRGVVAGVLVSERGRPLAGTVSASPEGGGWALPAGAASDAEGHFVLAGLAPGSYSIFAVPRNCEGRVLHQLTLHPGQLVQDLRLVYPLGETIAISGTVVGAEGKGIEASVTLMRQEYNIRREQAVARTELDGDFEFSEIPLSVYAISAQATGYDSASVADIDGDTTGIEIVLHARSHIRGTVADGRGHPVPTFDLLVEPGTRSPMSLSAARTIFDPDGVFDVEVAADSYALTVAASGFATARIKVGSVGEGRDAENVTVVLQEAGKCRGRVVSASGRPISGAFIFVGDVPIQPQRAGGRAVASSGPDGTFETPAMDPEEFPVISAFLPGAGAGATRVPVDAQSAMADIVLYPAGSLAVRVTRDGQPVTGVYAVVSRGRESASIKTGDDGTAVFEQLPDGELRVEVFDPDGPESFPRETIEIVSGQETETSLQI